MRIISQDGRNDFEYSAVTIYRYHMQIYIQPVWKMNGDGILVAHYSTEERAQHALENMWNAFKKVHKIPIKDGGTFFYEFPKAWRFPPDTDVWEV